MTEDQIQRDVRSQERSSSDSQLHIRLSASHHSSNLRIRIEVVGQGWRKRRVQSRRRLSFGRPSPEDAGDRIDLAREALGGTEKMKGRRMTHRECSCNVTSQRPGTQQQTSRIGHLLEVELRKDSPSHKFQIEVHSLSSESVGSSSKGENQQPAR